MSSDAANGINGDRAMREVIALDCWHGGFGTSRTAQLRIHVSFKTGEFSTDYEYGRVRFVVRLAEARLAVVIPPTEPIWIDPDKVFSGAPTASVKQTSQRVEGRSSEMNGRASLGLDKGKPKAGIGASGKRGSSRAFKQTVNSEIKGGPIAVRPWHEGGCYSWHLTSANSTWLDGEPWPRVQPIMKLKRTDSPGNRLDTAIYVEIKTKRDRLGIDITDFKRRPGSPFDTLFVDIPRNNLAAAEACIRNALLAEGLAVSGFDDPNAFITLAKVLASEPPR